MVEFFPLFLLVNIGSERVLNIKILLLNNLLMKVCSLNAVSKPNYSAAHSAEVSKNKLLGIYYSNILYFVLF